MEQKPENIKFSSFENFVIKNETKENPRNMSYILCSINTESVSGQQKENITILRDEIRRLFQAASIDKELVEIEPSRDFLKSSWQRDNFLYFNGSYFPWRWIDTKGQNRPEREALVLDTTRKKEGLDRKKYGPRIMKDHKEGVFAMGEGGLYVPDYDNNILLISDGIIAEEGSLSNEELYAKTEEMHKKIFGSDILVGIFPKPDNTPHLDTHLSLIPKTKIALLEDTYYKKLTKLNKLNDLEKLGYNAVKIPPVDIKCPLNILYLENSQGKICAFVNPRIPAFVKNMLKNNNVETYDITGEIADELDAHLGNIRCITNELHSKDPEFLRKMGYRG